MNINLDNPAGRLLQLITRGQQIKPEKECRLAWAELLGADPANLPLLTMRIGKAMALVDEITTAVNSCKKIRPETYLSFTGSLQKAFHKQKLSDQWASFINYIDPNTVNFIEITSDLLSMQHSEGVIDAPNLEEIEKNLDALSKEIAASKIEAGVKEFMNRRLETILASTQEYPLTGPKGLQEAVYAVVGELSIRTDIEEAMKKTYSGKKFGELIGKIFFVLNLTDAEHQVPETLMSLLPESDFVIDDDDIVEL
jgi:hypothetical protein